MFHSVNDEGVGPTTSRSMLRATQHNLVYEHTYMCVNLIIIILLQLPTSTATVMSLYPLQVCVVSFSASFIYHYNKLKRERARFRDPQNWGQWDHQGDGVVGNVVEKVSRHVLHHAILILHHTILVLHHIVLMLHHTVLILYHTYRHCHMYTHPAH